MSEMPISPLRARMIEDEAYGGTLGGQRPVIDPLRNAEAAVRLNVISKAEAT